MPLFIARLLILAASGAAAFMGLPREWIDMLALDPEAAMLLSLSLVALWKALWRYASERDMPK